MPDARLFARFAGWLAVLAAPLAWASLVLGLQAADFNFDMLSDSRALLSLGATGAAFMRGSFLLNMLGSYLMLVPIALWLQTELRVNHPHFVRWYTLCGLGYLLLGATGAAILGAVWPMLMQAYGSANAETQPVILLVFQTATALAEDGMQGVIQNLAGGVWWLGLGMILWQQTRQLGGFTLLLGAALLVNTLGNVFNSEPLSGIGLAATLLLAPSWGIWVGIRALRQA